MTGVREVLRAVRKLDYTTGSYRSRSDVREVLKHVGRSVSAKAI